MSNPTTPSFSFQHDYDYLIVLDFEATCDNSVPVPKVTSDTQEVIEFPFVVLRLLNHGDEQQQACSSSNEKQYRYMQVVDKKQYFVKPEWSSELTSFCTELTGITNDIINERGMPLKHVIDLFDQYLKENFYDKEEEEEQQDYNGSDRGEKMDSVSLKQKQKKRRFALVTDGQWDLKQLLLRETKKKHIALKSHYRTFFDLRAEFQSCFPYAVIRGLKSMVQYANIEFCGRHHSGISDCLTICELISVLLENGHSFRNPIVIDEHYDPFRDASFQKDFNMNRIHQRNHHHQQHTTMMSSSPTNNGHYPPHYHHYHSYYHSPDLSYHNSNSSGSGNGNGDHTDFIMYNNNSNNSSNNSLNYHSPTASPSSTVSYEYQAYQTYRSPPAKMSPYYKASPSPVSPYKNGLFIPEEHYDPSYSEQYQLELLEEQQQVYHYNSSSSSGSNNPSPIPKKGKKGVVTPTRKSSYSSPSSSDRGSSGGSSYYSPHYFDSYHSHHHQHNLLSNSIIYVKKSKQHRRNNQKKKVLSVSPPIFDDPIAKTTTASDNKLDSPKEEAHHHSNKSIEQQEHVLPQSPYSPTKACGNEPVLTNQDFSISSH